MQKFTIPLLLQGIYGQKKGANWRGEDFKRFLRVNAKREEMNALVILVKNYNNGGYNLSLKRRRENIGKP